MFPEINIPTPRISIIVYEDNTSAKMMPSSENFTQRTKHITLKYHWFKKYVIDGLIEIRHMSTIYQLTNMFSKPLDETTFKRLRKTTCGY